MRNLMEVRQSVRPIRWGAGWTWLLVLMILICCSAVPLWASGPTVRVWADSYARCDLSTSRIQHTTSTIGSPPCGIDVDHSIVFGPGFQNLFLVQDGSAYSTTGPTGSNPGPFGYLDTYDEYTNEGSALVWVGGTPFLMVVSESDWWIDSLPISGSGGTVSLGSSRGGSTDSYDTYVLMGQFSGIGDPEGAAVMEGTPRFSNGIPVFATAGVGSTLTVNGNTLPRIYPHWSGKTLLVVAEYPANLVAVPIDDNGSPRSDWAVALGSSTGPNRSFCCDPDQVAISQDGRFAYIHAEDGTKFWRMDLNHLDTTGGNGHIKQFITPGDWTHDPMVVLGSYVYTVAQPPGAVQIEPYRPPANQLFRMAMDPATGDLGLPEFVVAIDDGMGNRACGSRERLATDGKSIYVSDSCSGLVFQIAIYTGCAQDSQRAGSFEINPVTGDYSFTVASTGAAYSGRGIILYASGCTVILADLSTPGRLVKVYFNICTNTGVAYVQNANPFSILLVNQTAPNSCP